MTSQGEVGDDGVEAPKPPVKKRLTWVHHPAKEKPLLLAFAAGVIALFSAAIIMADGDLPMAIISALILVVSIAPFLVPTRYTLTQNRVVQSMPGFTRERRWQELVRIQRRGDGIFLSPFAKTSFLDGRRGLLLRGGDQEKILQFCQEQIRCENEGQSEGE